MCPCATQMIAVLNARKRFRGEVRGSQVVPPQDQNMMLLTTARASETDKLVVSCSSTLLVSHLSKTRKACSMETWQMPAAAYSNDNGFPAGPTRDEAE